MAFTFARLRPLSLTLGAALIAGSPAYADPWDRGFGPRPGIADVCSGEHARNLEARLQRQVDLRRIDPRTADRIHGAIDRNEFLARRECGEHDDAAISRIAYDYHRIGSWMAREAYRGSRW